MTKEAVEALCAVAAREAVKPEGNLEDGKPLVVGPLWHVGLQVFRADAFPFACDAGSRKQVAVLGYEAGSVASAQQNERKQHKQGFYETFGSIHATKVRLIIQNSKLINSKLS